MKKEWLDAADIRMDVLYEKQYPENSDHTPKNHDTKLKALLYANPFLKAQTADERQNYIDLAMMLSQIAASKGATIEVLLFEDQETISTVISASQVLFSGVEIGKLIRVCASSSMVEIGIHPDDRAKSCLYFDYMFSVEDKLLPLFCKQLLDLDESPENRF